MTGDNQKQSLNSSQHSTFLLLLTKVENLTVPECKSGFERPINSSDFSTYVENCDERLQTIINFTESLIANYEYNLDQLLKKIICSTIILCGEHSSSNLWTTDNSLNLSKWILDKVISASEFSSVIHALVSENGSILKYVLKDLRPKLLKNSWKNYPAAVNCYAWVLKQVETPHLSEHLPCVIPTALIITDDFVSANRIIGLQCLEHIVNNVGRTHLSWHGQDEVIMKALEPIVYQKEDTLIEPLMNTLTVLLKKKHPQIIYANMEMNEFDNILELILNNMRFEQRLTIRSAYAASLPKMLQARGLGMLRHSSLLVEVIREYMLEPTSCLVGLNMLDAFITVCWPRIHPHAETFLLIISKVGLGLKSQRYPIECKSMLHEVVMKLKKVCPETVEKWFEICQTENLNELHDILLIS